MAVFFHITIWISVVALDLFWMLWPRHTVQVYMEQHFLTSGLICLRECKPLVLCAALLLVFWFYSSFHAAHNPILVALPLMVLSSDVSFWKKMPLIKYPMQLHFEEIWKAPWILKEQTKTKAGKTYLMVPKKSSLTAWKLPLDFSLTPQYLSYALWFYTLPQSTLSNILELKCVLLFHLNPTSQLP